MTTTGLAILSGKHLAQIIVIAVVVLIGLAIFSWARWERRRQRPDM
jgi:hypothetical protein